uniref:Uncharacterized protein n=1 Tax=Rangifer tarandus platyrhynchus TaxID=3082113 RepID=A0ACB0DTW2_RANTA|nr:unnamed protein product [Rangifer tarandus platyrhynchus]
MGNGGPAGEVGANGQSWKGERPASYGDGNEFGRVRKEVGEGCHGNVSPLHGYGHWSALRDLGGQRAGAHTYLWGSVPRQRGPTAEAEAGAREAPPPPPPPPPPHTGVRSAAQHSPCRAPASDWRRWLPPEPERTANEMLMTCAEGGVPDDQSRRREPNPALGGLAPSPTPPPGTGVRRRARAT